MKTLPIPDKLYFKIGEVSHLTGLKPYVLRYWQTEFPEIAPVKSRTNQRLYRKKDVELVLKIRSLLYEEKFTINGARKRLKVDLKAARKGETPQMDLDLVPKEALPVDLKAADIQAAIDSIVKEMTGLLRD